MTLTHGVDPKTKEWILPYEQTKDWGWFTWLTTIISILDTSPKLTMERENEVLDKLKSCSPTQTFKLDPNDIETQMAFKCIIDWGQDIQNGFQLTFNNDYSKIRKEPYPFVPSPKTILKK